MWVRGTRESSGDHGDAKRVEAWLDLRMREKRFHLGAALLLHHLGEEHRVDVGQDAAGRDGHLAEELVQLLVVADSELDVAGDDAGLLVVARGVARELKHLSGEVLEHSGQVDGGTAADTGGVLASLEEATDTPDGELQASLGRPRG